MVAHRVTQGSASGWPLRVELCRGILEDMDRYDAHLPNLASRLPGAEYRAGSWNAVFLCTAP